MDSKQIYSDYNEKVQEYMQNVIDCLEQDYGKIPSSWRISLDLIADNYDVYLKAMDDVRKNGLIRTDNQNRTFKNQCFSIAAVAQTALTNLLKSFALTPMSKSKMKQFSADSIDEDDYLDNLIK